MKPQAAPMQILLSIVERGRGAFFAEHYKKFQVPLHIHATGKGTVSSHLLDTLGFATEERDVMISIASKQAVLSLLHHLHDEDRSKLGARGIACSIPVNGMSAAMALGVVGTQETKEEIKLDQTRQHSLILISVNQGYTDEVMDTARAAGARGGTVIRARWTGAESVENFLHVPLQSEKELLLIIASLSDRNAIMDAVNREHGLTSAAQAAVISVPVDGVARLD